RRLGRLVAADLGTEGDAEAVPAVDGDDREGEVDQFFFAEVFAYGVVDVVRHTVYAESGQRLGPLQRRTFAIAVERRFAPGIEQIKPLLRLARGAGILAVHVETVGAAVDLRSTHFDEFDQAVFQPALVDVVLQSQHRLRGAGELVEVCNTGFHVGSFRSKAYC